MTAEVIELRPGQEYLVPVPKSLWGRVRSSNTGDRVEHFLETSRVVDAIFHPFSASPVVIIRRSKMHRRERNAFELGREYAGLVSRR